MSDRSIEEIYIYFDTAYKEASGSSCEDTRLSVDFIMRMFTQVNNALGPSARFPLKPGTEPGEAGLLLLALTARTLKLEADLSNLRVRMVEIMNADAVNCPGPDVPS